jgi:hypothetical protein
MIIIAFASYPPESARDMGTRFVELSPAPNFINSEGPYMYSDGNDGIKAVSLYKFDRSRAAEALAFVNEQHAVFFGIEGYRYDIRICAGAEIAMKMSGL